MTSCALAIGDDLIIMDLHSGDYLLQAGIDEDQTLDERLEAAGHRDALRCAEPAGIALRDIPPSQVVIMPALRLWPSLIRARLETAWRLRQSPERWIRWHRDAPVGRVACESEIVRLVDDYRSACLILPGLGLCLAHSIGLAVWLRMQGVRCRWVFGVRTHPFEAHCWLEWEDLVLTDSVDHIAWFTPIIAC